ncbi:MobA/MobL family protein (plasmid) [Thioclava sp. GXIMD4216]
MATRPSAARVVLRERLSGVDDAAAANAAEEAAFKSKGRVCERFIIALPVEASAEQRVALVAAFAEQLTAGKAGFVAALHDQRGNDLRNPHFHLVAFDVHEKSGGRGRPRSVIGLARKGAVEAAAKSWADVHNGMMTQWGFGRESLIDHRSFATREIERIPTIHEGPAARAMAAKRKIPAPKAEWQRIDSGTSRADANKIIRDINKDMEKLNEHTHRLGTGDDRSAEQRESRRPPFGADIERRRRDCTQPQPPFVAPRPDAKDLGCDAGGVEEPPASNPAFDRGSQGISPIPPIRSVGPLRRWRHVRRVYRELLMLRETLRVRLLRIEAQRRPRATPAAVQVEQDAKERSPGRPDLPHQRPELPLGR